MNRYINSPVPSVADLPLTDLPGSVRSVGGVNYRLLDRQWMPEDASGRVTGSPPAITSGGNLIDWAAGPTHSRVLSENTVFEFANADDGETIIVSVTAPDSNDYTSTWPGAIKWAGGSAPTQSPGVSTDVYTFTKHGSVIYGAVSQNHS